MDRSLEIFLRQLYAGTGEVWLAVAYVVCMFGVSAFRPRRIGTPALFRLSYILCALYLVVPSVAFSILEIKEARRTPYSSVRASRSTRLAWAPKSLGSAGSISPRPRMAIATWVSVEVRNWS